MDALIVELDAQMDKVQRQFADAVGRGDRQEAERLERKFDRLSETRQRMQMTGASNR